MSHTDGWSPLKLVAVAKLRLGGNYDEYITRTYYVRFKFRQRNVQSVLLSTRSYYITLNGTANYLYANKMGFNCLLRPYL